MDMKSTIPLAKSGLLAAMILSSAACFGIGDRSGSPPKSAVHPAARLVLAVVGDFGCWTGSGCAEVATAQPAEAAVARLVHSWAPDAIVSDGDNSYPDSATESRLRTNLTPYLADLAAGRFYTALGDRDWAGGDDAVALRVYGKPAHYSQLFGSGLAAVFFADTHGGDPDGSDSTSAQAQEFRHDLGTVHAIWKITVNHEPQYGSGPLGSYPQYRWLTTKGVDLSIAGGHYAEHVVVNGLNYVIEGSGGETLGEPCSSGCVEGSVWHDGTHYGALRLTITRTSLRADFVGIDGVVLHSFTVTK
jgi:hypothetical protein